MYPNPYYPPPPEDVERVAKTVIRLLERDKKQKAKAKEIEERKAKEASHRMMTSLEWFIIGILLQPVIHPLYNLAIHKITSMTP